TITIALGIISRSKTVRRKVFRTTVLALNEVPLKGLDMIIEYNDLLIRRGHEDVVRARFASDLSSAPLKWDELKLSWVPKSIYIAISKCNWSFTPVIYEVRISFTTDIRQTNVDLGNLLSPFILNRRWKIRLSIKAIQVNSDLTLR